MQKRPEVGRELTTENRYQQSFDLNLPRTPLRLLRHRDGHLEHAILERRVARFSRDAFGQRERSLELAVAPLAVVVALTVVDVFLGALAGDGEYPVVDLDGDVLFPQAGKVGANDELVAATEGFDRRHPPRARETVRRAASSGCRTARKRRRQRDAGQSEAEVF